MMSLKKTMILNNHGGLVYIVAHVMGLGRKLPDGATAIT
jgi:hypothetical protein